MCACRRAHGLTRKGHTDALFVSSCVCSPRGLVSVTRPKPSPWSARPLKGERVARWVGDQGGSTSTRAFIASGRAGVPGPGGQYGGRRVGGVLGGVAWCPGKGNL